MGIFLGKKFLYVIRFPDLNYFYFLIFLMLRLTIDPNHSYKTATGFMEK